MFVVGLARDTEEVEKFGATSRDITRQHATCHLRSIGIAGPSALFEFAASMGANVG
jgi:hypothetical protein